MRVRMLVQMPPGGLRNGEPWPGEGEEADIPTGEALHLVASGVAEEVTEAPPPPAARRRKGSKEDAG